MNLKSYFSELRRKVIKPAAGGIVAITLMLVSIPTSARAGDVISVDVGQTRMSISRHQLQGLLAPPISCRPVIPVAVTFPEGVTVDVYSMEIFGNGYEIEYLNESLNRSGNVEFDFRTCAEPSWKTKYWFVQINTRMCSTFMIGSTRMTTCGKYEFLFDVVDVAPNRAIPSVQSVGVTAVTTQVTLLVSAKQKTGDGRFTYEYRYGQPGSVLKGWKSSLEPVIGITKLKRKTRYALEIRAVAPDGTKGKVHKSYFSTK